VTHRPGLVAGMVVCALLVVAGLLPPAAAGPDRVDPAALPRGPAPGVVHLVRDTIRDGELRIPATTQGRHDALWVVSGGYVLRDYDVGPRRLVRVVFVDPTGARRVVARSPQWVGVEVSPDGGRVAVQRSTGATAQRSVVTVEEPASGRVLARRELSLATLVAVTRSRVLLALRARWRDPATVWWSFETDRTRRLVGQAAVDADVRHDRIVLLTPRAGEFCNRVAPLSHPGRTLWRSCRTMPHEWSPDGRHALLTWAYFDAAGTDRWWVVDGRTGETRGRITGRLDKHAVWEDSTHFLVNAQGETGRAGVVRCDVQGTCDRATRLWDTPLPSEPSIYYRSPPVVLAGR
jgi:hypothetical protein